MKELAADLNRRQKQTHGLPAHASYDKRMTVSQINQYTFCPADEEILERLQYVCKNI